MRFLTGARYVNDGAVAIAYNNDNPESIARAHYLHYSLMNSCYPDSLELKLEDTSHGTFRFLETITNISSNRLHIEHFLKNQKPIQDSGYQRFFNLKHSASFEPRTTKFGAVLSRFLSISRCTPCNERLYTIART